jgi:acyl carrier protein
MRERVKQVMAELFECSPEAIPDAASPATLAGWDSLRQIELMLALEIEFSVRIPTEEMLELVSLPSIEGFLCEHASGYRQTL